MLIELHAALSRVRYLPKLGSYLVGLFADFLLNASLSWRYFIPVVNVLRSIEDLDVGSDLVTVMMHQMLTLESVIKQNNLQDLQVEKISHILHLCKWVEQTPSALPNFIRICYTWMKISPSSISLQDTITWMIMLLRNNDYDLSSSCILELGLFLLEVFESEPSVFHEQELLDHIRQTSNPFLRSISLYAHRYACGSSSLSTKDFVQSWKSVSMKSLKDPFEKDVCSLISLIASAPSWRLSISYFKYLFIYIAGRFVEWKQLYGSAIIHVFVQYLVAETCTTTNYLAAAPLISNFLQRPISWYDAASAHWQVKQFLSSFSMLNVNADEHTISHEVDLVSYLLMTYIKESRSRFSKSQPITF
jgi:hypothetical protein